MANYPIALMGKMRIAVICLHKDIVRMQGESVLKELPAVLGPRKCALSGSCYYYHYIICSREQSAPSDRMLAANHPWRELFSPRMFLSLG